MYKINLAILFVLSSSILGFNFEKIGFGLDNKRFESDRIHIHVR